MAQWMVGPEQPTSGGYCFSVQDARGAPLVTITFATKDECNDAEEKMRSIIDKAIDVVAPPR